MRALKKITLREIRHSIGRFAAIFSICALGVGFFSGLRVTRPSMVETGNNYIESHVMYDFKLISDVGFSADCDDEMASEDNVKFAEGSHERDILMTFDGNDSAVAVKSITENINTLSLKYGSLPSKPDECIADGRYFGSDDIGKTISVAEDGDDEVLKYTDFKVVGIADSCCYLNYERGSTTVGSGTISYFLYVDPDAFNEDFYTALYVKLEGDEAIYTDEYNEKIDKYRDSIEAAGIRLTEKRLDDIAAATAAKSGADKIPGAAEEIRKNLEAANVFLLGRAENTGYVCFENDSTIVEGISTVFPVFFFLVAALVCATTMTRMVEEERTQIGTLKALGFSSGSIASKYIFYSGSAALSGAVLGYFVGCNAFPAAIWKVYGIMYGFADITVVYSIPLFFISLAVALICSAGTAYIACRRSLILRPAELIRPKSPKNGKRIIFEKIGFFWNRLSFLAKVSFRNVLRYKSRMVMMILGVGGCCALLLTGLGINDSIKNIVDFQFDDIMTYSYRLTFSNDMSGKEQDFAKKYGSYIESALFLHSAEIDVKSDKTTDNATLITVGDGAADFIDLHDGKEKLDFPRVGQVILSNKLFENLGVEVGDTVTLCDSEMNKVDLEVSAVCDNYVYDYAYISPETLTSLWDTDASMKTAYVIAGGDTHESAAAVSADENVLSTLINDDLRENVSRMMSSLNYIILLLSACAAALAFIVIYNLTNINITERIREIATIKVLGFRRGEVGAYVFRENFSLSVVGAAAGLFMGIMLHAYVMSCIRVDMVSFETRIAPQSFIIAFAVTLVFSAAVNLAMFKKLDRINMAESLKSADG